MKKKWTDFLAEAIIFIAIVFCFLLLLCCKTPTKTQINTESDSIYVSNLSVVRNDSLIKQILSSLTFEYDYTIKKFSKPDSAGNQHVEEEHTIKGHGKQDVETTETIKSNNTIIRNDSSAIKNTETIISTPVKVLTWWDRFCIKIGNWALVIGLICLGYTVYWLRKRNK